MDASHQGPAQPDVLIGQTIGNYLVTQKLGEGGMGAVYLAEHPTIGKKVALKVLHSEFSSNQEVAARFFNEAKAVNDIGHPNIVDIVDFGILQQPGRDQLVYFIMEYIQGRTLSQLIRAEAPMAPERALSIALQVADALAASHKCGIVHRDLKPDNIILTTRGREADFVKLLDFGIAKLTNDSAKGSARTRTGLVMGTPAYMSPEQCEGRGTVDHRTDVYALGIVVYEMLVGRVPFVGEGYGDILIQHLTQRPVPPSQFRMMPAHVEAVVMKALEKRVEMRYPTMDEMMRAMADPVGYVEAHGGVVNFMQAQLMPSNAPLPAIRLTPAPLTAGMMSATPTPGPGAIPPMMTPGPGALRTPTGLQMAPMTPAPTTLGGAAGQVEAPRSKSVFVIAGAVVVAAAIGGVTILMMNRGGNGGGGGDPNAVKTPDPTPKTPDPTPKTPDPTPKTPDPAPDMSKVTLSTTPPGAEVFVDNVDQKAVTPASIQLPRNKAVKISFKLDGYLPIEREEPIDQPAVNYDFTLTAKETPKPTDGSGSAGSGSNVATTPPVDHTTHTTPVDHTIHHTTQQQQQQQNHQTQQQQHTGSNTQQQQHTGSNTQQQHHDSDGVMKPGDI